MNKEFFQMPYGSILRDPDFFQIDEKMFNHSRGELDSIIMNMSFPDGNRTHWTENIGTGDARYLDTITIEWSAYENPQEAPEPLQKKTNAI